MSGLAFSALIIFCLLIPGLVFQFRYYRSAAARWETSGNIDTSTARALLLAVLFCLPLHAFWGFGIAAIDRWVLPIGTINYQDLLALLTGDSALDGSNTFVQLNRFLPLKVTLYVWSQAAAGFYIGSLAASTAEKIGWSKKVALASRGAFWHRTLQFADGEPDGIIVSMTVPICRTTYLYYGLLYEYMLNETGDLQRIVLQGAARRALTAGNDEDTYDIPGEYFVVNCQNVDTVDIDYFWMEDQENNG